MIFDVVVVVCVVVAYIVHVYGFATVVGVAVTVVGCYVVVCIADFDVVICCVVVVSVVVVCRCGVVVAIYIGFL